MELLMELVVVHPIFDISILRKCVGDLNIIVPLDNMSFEESLTNEEVSIEILDNPSEEVSMEILDNQVKILRKKKIASVKVLWRN